MALGALLWTTPALAQVPPSCPSSLSTADIIEHNFSVSFCELCGVGTVRLDIENPYSDQDDVDFSDLVVTENLQASGLTYVAGRGDDGVGKVSVHYRIIDAGGRDCLGSVPCSWRKGQAGW